MDVYVPGGHVKHVADPAVAYVPLTHTCCSPSAVPGGQEYPALHVRHCDEDVLPATLPYVPAGQLRHGMVVVAPIDVEYVPMTQFRQTKELVEVIDSDHVPAPHNMQVEAPVRDEYEPAEHMRQNVERNAFVGAVVEYVPIAQFTQAALDVAEMTDDHVPVAHDVHAVEPCRDEYVPSAHPPQV